MYFIQHCFICHPSDSTVSEDAGIEPRKVGTLALAFRPSNHLAKFHPGCSMSKWLARWSAVRQSRVRFPTGTPPSAQQEENYLPRCRSHLPSSGRKNTQQENIPRKNNVCIVREITKINKKSAGHGTHI
jgi:hypothetical protein